MLEAFWNKKEKEIEEIAEGQQAEDEVNENDAQVNNEEDEYSSQADDEGVDEGQQAEDEEAEDKVNENDEKEPTGEDEVDYFMATETTSYRTKEEAVKGIEEKDKTIERLKNDLILAKTQTGSSVQPPPQNPQVPEITKEEYFELLEKIEEEEGETAKVVRLVADAVSVQLNQREQAEQYRKNEFNRYSSEIRSKYGDTISENEIREMYDLSIQIREGKGNPVELLLIRKAKKSAKAIQDKKNQKEQLKQQQKKKRAANSFRQKSGQFDPNKRSSVIKLQEKVNEAKQKGSISDFLDAKFELNKPQQKEKRPL